MSTTRLPEPCPFCGDDGAEVAESTIPKLGGGFKRAVYCNCCFCEGPPALTDEHAIERWNSRALPLPEQGSPQERRE